jgi:thiamine kinase
VIGPKAGEGREAEVYAWGDDAVVKLYRPGYVGHRAESVALARLDGHSVAPRLIDIVGCDGRPGLVLERLGGSDMLELLQRQPWRVLDLARALAKARLAVHGVQAPGDLPDLRQVLAARIEDAVLPPPLRAFALRVLGGLPTGDRLCHGDFHPGNVLVAADRVSVIDWANAARGVPEADHARTVLLLRWADPLPGTPLISRGLMTAGRFGVRPRLRADVRRRLAAPVAAAGFMAGGACRGAPVGGHRGRAAQAHRVAGPRPAPCPALSGPLCAFGSAHAFDEPAERPTQLRRSRRCS